MGSKRTHRQDDWRGKSGGKQNKSGAEAKKRAYDRLRSRRSSFEPLEARLTMNGDPTPWDNAMALSMSFAPDGTKVGAHVSTLDAELSPIEATSVWQEAMARAFQTWAQYANINIGVVPDDGLPLGVRGASHGDDRFGDIRVAGTPMSAETYAAAIDQTRLSAGTWTGDMLFNTEATWATPNDIFSAALHEAGHVLGLQHSTDPSSPMFTHGVSSNLTPTANDIAALQALYGPRVADENERTQDNNSIGRAVRFKYSEPIDGFNGTLPLVQFGDLHSSTDSDFFELPVLAGYSGTLTFEVRTGGLSLLAPRVTVFDKKGDELSHASFTGHMGGTASVTVNAVAGEKMYVRIDRATSDLYEYGGYAVVVKYDGLLTTPEADIAQAVKEGFRWRGQTDDTFANIDVRPILSGSETPHVDDDAGTDDTLGGAKRLKPIVDTTTLRKYQYVGTISATNDVDFYTFRAPSFNAPETRGMTVTIESLEKNGVIGDFQLLDTTGVNVPVTVIANGTGLVIFHADNVQSNKDYTVRVQTHSTATSTHTGNYTVTAKYDSETLTRNTFLSQHVDATQLTGGFTLFVARTQLFSLGIDSTAVAGDPNAIAWLTIYDSQSRPVFMAASKAGTFRSAPSILLDPGEYRVQIASRLADGLTTADTTITLYGSQLSDPVGPPLVDPGSTPLYSCPSGDPNPYCYPGGTTSSVPYTFVPGTTTPPPDVTQVQVSDPGDAWFWFNEYLGTNPVNPIDVNGDGNIAPVDALLVVNFLNQSGPGPLPPPPVQMPFLDVTADQTVAPIDALRIINQLNGVGGEGERVSVATIAKPAAPTSPTNQSIDAVLAMWNDDSPTNAAHTTHRVHRRSELAQRSSGSAPRDGQASPVFVLPVTSGQG